MASTQVQMFNNNRRLATKMKGFGCFVHENSSAVLFAAAAPDFVPQ